MKGFCGNVLTVFVMVGSLSAAAGGAADVAPETARRLQEYIRPWTSTAPGDPAVLCGFNRSAPGDGRGAPRWTQPLDGGSTTMRPFGSGGSPVPVAWWFWYRAEVRPVFAWERSFSDGREWLEKQKTSSMRPVDVGEGGLLDEKSLTCLAYRGPLYLQVQLHLDWVLRSVGQGAQPGSVVAEWSTALRQEWPAPYQGLTDASSVTAQKDSYLKDAPRVLLALARDILAGAPAGQSGTAAAPPAAGPPALRLTASPQALWADGSSRSTIRLEVRDAQGRPVKGEFPVECSRGKLSHIRLITDASGVATAHYTAPADGPGKDVVTVAAPDGTQAKVSIALGGLDLRPAGEDQWALFGDGRSSVELVATCSHPSGKPLPGTKVKLFVDERELPARGRLSAQSVTAGPDGSARFSYTAPDVYSAASDFRRGDVYVTAVASVGNPPREVRSVHRVSLYAGEVYLLEVSKAAFRRIEGFRVPAPVANGVLSGTVMAATPDGGKVPLRAALLRLSSRDGTLLGKGTSDLEGRFRFEFIGDRMSNTGREVGLSEPLVTEVDEDLRRIISEWGRDLEIFSQKGYDVSAMREFRDGLCERLAASTEGSPDRMLDTEYLAYGAMRLCALCRYLKLLDEREAESAEWFAESLKNGVQILADTLKVSEMLRKGAQGKLKERFSPKQWQEFEESLLRQFVALVAQQFQKGVDAAKAINVDTEVPEAFTGFGSDFLVKKGVEHLSGSVKEGLTAAGQSSTRRLLSAWGMKAVTGAMPSSEALPGISAAKELLTSYEARHNRLNLDHLDRELYRLDAKLVVDTVIKGPFIYAKLKNLAADPEVMSKIAELDVTSLESIQDALKDAAEPVTDVFNAVDLMFQSYQGYQWVADLLDAERVKQEVAKAIFR